ncbi:MAG: DUF6252 family protein [Vicingaceae bacterium]
MRNYLLYIFILLFVAACEEPEPLTADDFVNEDLQAFLNPPFQVEVDRATFFEETVSASFAQGQLVVRAFKGDEQIAFTTKDIEEGIYTGDASGFNQVYYQDGTEAYASLSMNSTNDAEIVILDYDETNSLISGTFEGTVINANNGKSLRISDGKFNDLKVEAPFTGNMASQINNNASFSSSNCQYVSTSNQGTTVETITAYTAGNQKSITIIIRRAISPGIYNLSDPEVSFTYNDDTFNSDPATVYSGQSGNIQITNVNQATGQLSGTFEIQAQNFNGNVLNFQMGNFTAVSP